MDVITSWARMRGWDVTRDPSLAFQSKTLRDALEAWRSHAGDGIPARSAMTARVLRAFLGNVVIFERVGEDPPRHLIRLMGTKLTSVLGEMQGKMIDEALPYRAAKGWASALDDTLAEGRPLRFVTGVAFRDHQRLTVEVLLAPLSDDHGRPVMVFAAVVFEVGVAAAPSLDTLLTSPLG